MIENGLYQIQLFRKGEIEIFQNVFTHKLHVVDGEVKGIELKWGPDAPGSCTNSMRPMDGVYDVRMVNEPVYEHCQPYAGAKDIKIKIN